MNFFHAVSVFSLALLVMGCGPQTPEQEAGSFFSSLASVVSLKLCK